MTTALRNTGIEPVGEMPWGTHFCHFYETRDDLLETLLPFFKAGLEANEFCAWVVSEPLTEQEVWQALDRAVPGLDRYVSDQSIEVLKARDVYLAGGEINLLRIIGNWSAKLKRALSGGYQGIRVSGNTAWLEQKHWRDFMGPLHVSAHDERRDRVPRCGGHPPVRRCQASWPLGNGRDASAHAGEGRDRPAQPRSGTAGARAHDGAGGGDRGPEAGLGGAAGGAEGAGARHAAHDHQRADRIAGP